MQYLSKSETIVRWSTFLLFLLTPFFFLPVPWMSTAQGKILLSTVTVTIGFLAWIVMSLKESDCRIPKSSLLIAALLVPLAYLASALVAGPAWESLVGDGSGQDTVLNFTIWYLALFLSAVVLGGTQDGPSRALRLLLSGSLVVLLVQTIRLAVPAFTFGGALQFPVSSVVGTWHDLAIYLSLVLFITLALMRTPARTGIWRYLSIIIAVLSFGFLSVINSADTWLAFGIVCFLYALYSYRAQSIDWDFGGKRIMLVFLALAAASGALYLGGTFVQRSLPASLQITQVEVRPSWQGTFAIGREVFAEPTQLFFGSGPNTFSREWGRHKPLSVNQTQFWETDFYYGVGFIPTSFVTTGVAGLIAWIAVCAAVVYSLVRLFRFSRDTSRTRAVLVLSAAFLTAYHVVYVPGPALSLLTFLLLGATVAEGIGSGIVSHLRISLSWETLRGKVTAVLLVFVGLAFLFGSIQSARAILSDAMVSRAIANYRESGDLTKASRSVAIALIVLPGNGKAHRAGVELGLLQLARLASSSAQNADAAAELQGTLNATIQHGLAAVSIESRDYQNWLTLARLYSELAGAGVSGAEAEARNAYEQAVSSSPTTPLPYLGLAQLDLLHGEDASAKTNLEKALQIKLDFAPAHFLLSQIDARANRLEDAKRHATSVVEIAPEDALGWYNAGTIFYASSEYANAALALERAVALQNNYANALFLLGLSYYRLDRVEDSLRALRAVAATNPDDAVLKDAIAKIEDGEDPFEK